MKICCLSDLHGNLPTDLPRSDLIVVAGDICPDYVRPSHGHQANWLNTEWRKWLEYQSAPVVATWGNHDFVGEKPDLIPTDLPWTLLVDEGATIKGLKIWGTPWSVRFGHWAFMLRDEALRTVYEKIPPEINLLISHGPPLAVCDETAGHDRAGSNSINKAVQFCNRHNHITALVCGHIHEARGVGDLYGTMVLNVSSVDLSYQLRDEPWTLLEL